LSELARTESPSKEDQALPMPAKVDECERSQLQAPDVDAADGVTKAQRAPDNPHVWEGDQAERREAGDQPRDKEEAGEEEEGSWRKLQNGLGLRERRPPRRDERWRYLCQVDATTYFGGVSPERLYYFGSIHDQRPGTREGLPWEYSPTRKAQAYLLTSRPQNEC
jgi:hypothetical protein